ncbi:MAG TPA: BamA/TamA family outer membrane protein [Bacteroidota bacterium]|nr:BamA/TamA family outer membrane protein [Bacteroidota bacterium]
MRVSPVRIIRAAALILAAAPSLWSCLAATPSLWSCLAAVQVNPAFGDTVGIPDSLWIVDSVIVTGNRETKDFVILREMTLVPGSRITTAELEFDQNRIYSLRLFNQVRIGVEPSAPGFAHLHVEVSERWYIFPFPIVGLRDRDWNKIFFGIGIMHQNFLGRNEKLFAALVLGYDPSLSFSYRNPFLNDGGTEFLAAQLSLSTVRNRSLLTEDGGDNYDERHVSAGMSLGKRIGIEHTISLTVGYEYVDVTAYLPGRTVSTSGRDRYPTTNLSYNYDTRDLGEYPSRGSYAGIGISTYGFPSSELGYVRYGYDVRQFIPLPGGLTFAARGYGDLAAGGVVPPYDHEYFGYGNRIRGHFREIVEGEQLTAATVELHLPLFTPVYMKVDKLPAEFGLWRFGIAAALFADAGEVWYRGTPFAVNRFIKGYGAGLHFLLPYSYVLRLEYALNEIRHGEFIVDLGGAL